jgi:hypothetical protein
MHWRRPGGSPIDDGAGICDCHDRQKKGFRKYNFLRGEIRFVVAVHSLEVPETLVQLLKPVLAVSSKFNDHIRFLVLQDDVIDFPVRVVARYLLHIQLKVDRKGFTDLIIRLMASANRSVVIAFSEFVELPS